MFPSHVKKTKAGRIKDICHILWAIGERMYNNGLGYNSHSHEKCKSHKISNLIQSGWGSKNEDIYYQCIWK